MPENVYHLQNDFSAADTSASEIWEKILSLVKQSVSELKYNTWFKPIKAKSFSGNSLVVSVPSKDFYNIVTSRFGENLNKALSSIGDCSIVLTPVFENHGLSSHETQEKGLVKENLAPAVVHSIFQQIPRQLDFSYQTSSRNRNANINPDLTFENFVRGANNDFAVAAAISISNMPGRQYNPLMIYGGVGLGKTHLVQAIGNHILLSSPCTRVVYVTGPDFTTSFVQSIRTNNAHEFEKFYRSLDVLIVDDIQFLEGKEGTQNSFFQIFNSLYQLRKQIILSCDKPPHQLVGLEERLITRFQWGLTVDIQPPDLETRIAILNKKCEIEQVSISYDILEFVALNIKDNIRSLEGCLKNIIFESQLLKSPVNHDIAKRAVLKCGTINTKNHNFDISTVISHVANFFNIEESLLRLKTKRQEVVTARHVAMFLSKEFTGQSLQTIGAHFGGRNHATVIYACRCVEKLIKKDSYFNKKIEQLKERLFSF